LWIVRCCPVRDISLNDDLVYAYEGNKGVELGVDQKDNFLGAYNRMPGKSLFPHPYPTW